MAKGRVIKRHPLITKLMIERMALGMSQVDVCELVGLSRDAVSALESGKRNASLATFEKYAKGVGYQLAITPIPTEG